MADMGELFPRHAEIFPHVVTKVLKAAASGMMNDYQATASEQVSSVRLLMQCSPGQCSWAADAVKYLLEAGSYAHIYDLTVLPNVVDELKKSEVNRDLVCLLLTHTNIDQVLLEHGLPGSPPMTTIREHLHLTVPNDCKFFYGVEAPVKYDIEGRPILPSDLTDFEREMCVVPQGRGDPHDAVTHVMRRPTVSEKRQKGDPAM